MKSLSVQKTDEDQYVRKVYSQIILLSILIHVSYVVIFAALSFVMPLIYNFCSMGYYFIAFIFVRKGFYRTAVALTHLEVCVFAIVCTLLTGWWTGIPLFLIAASSLVYFCPYDHKFIPYLFSVLEICVFILLRLFAWGGGYLYPEAAEPVNTAVFIYSACVAFAIILYSAFVSRISATVTKKVLENENEALSALANYDLLTGLYSRHAFLTKLEECAGRYFIALGDIDDFKAVNDTYGHMCGDEILRKIGKIMKEYCEGKADVCRWGGEEFLLLIRGGTLEDAQNLVNGLRKKVEKAVFSFEKQQLHMTMTFGIAENMDDLSQDMDALINLADERMYQGKKQGKNRVVLISAE